MYAHTFICTSMHILLHTFMHAHTYIYIHTHIIYIHTHAGWTGLSQRIYKFMSLWSKDLRQPLKMAVTLVLCKIVSVYVGIR